MADTDETKSAEAEYESDDADELSASRWTARRMDASDDDDDGSGGDEAKEKYHWSCACLRRDESDGSEGASEYYSELEEGGDSEDELEEVSQEEEKLQETVHRVIEVEEKKDASDEVFVPRYGSFYMHDDRFLGRRRPYRTRRGTITGMKLWDGTDEPKWKHDKFEDTAVQESFHYNDKLWSNCQQQGNIRAKGHRYADTNQFGSLDNYGNQKNRTSRIVKGRGPVKYKPTVKSNYLNPSSKYQIPAKRKESTYSFSRVPSHASSHDIFLTRKSNEQYGRSNKCITRYSQQENKQLASLQMGGEMVGYSFPYSSQLTYQPCSIQENQGHGNRIPLPPITIFQHEGLLYDAIDDHTRSMALVGYAPQSQRGSRNRAKTSSKT